MRKAQPRFAGICESAYANYRFIFVEAKGLIFVLMNTTAHIPVLVEEAVTGLNLKPGDNVIDATLGGGGHAEAMLEATAPNGKLLGIDWDPRAIELARQKLQKYQNRIFLTVGNYRDIKTIAYEPGFGSPHGILLDLGLSTDQLQDESRGFSFSSLGPLDMRFSDQGELTAREIVNTWSEKELTHIFRTYGEERHAARIARLIIEHRQRAPIVSVSELVKLVMRGAGARGGRIHPATRVFQALRIATNAELENLSAALLAMIPLLAPGGRLAVISFHSLEDRIVKQFFKRESTGCLCPPELPECRCGHQARLRLVNKKVIVPNAEEIKGNPSSRSAKLRIAEKL